MGFEEIICEKLRSAGNIKAKKMFGAFNICLDNTNLGIVCENKWYLKKTTAGDIFIKQNGIKVETGIKDKSYIITDFSDDTALSKLARITCDELKSR